MLSQRLIDAVNRRVGGLEINPVVIVVLAIVNRRVGGLEIADMSKRELEKVNRRVGGLEKISPAYAASCFCEPPCRRLRKKEVKNGKKFPVNRRVGGLEI